jgi:UDP-N-acetylmuramoyl-tripeptide--D-alanyl-D-alanine ligase
LHLSVDQIKTYVGGSYTVAPNKGSELEAFGVTWDSREVEPGDLYVALEGQRVDGHDFIDRALDAGVCGALIMHDLPDEVLTKAQAAKAAIIFVDDTYRAIRDLAAGWRNHLQGHIIALTGSTGKTTTKNLIRDVLSTDGLTVATKANQNNELGVPKTILSASEDTKYIVVEMGMRGLGQIAELCEFVRPDWGLIVNVGESHIELLKSRDNIARAKSELFEALPSGGYAFVNAADDYASFVRENTHLDERGVNTVLFDGTYDAPIHMALDRNTPAVWAEEIHLDLEGCPEFTIKVRGVGRYQDELASASCTLQLRGLHNVSNAVSACAVGCACGLSLDDCAKALAQAQPEKGRQEFFKTSQGYTVINDAYNANPDSMRASLMTFCALDTPGKLIAVLGDMGELGDYAVESHERIGSLIGTLPLDELICIGDLATHIADAARSSGMDPARITCVSQVDEILDKLRGRLGEGDIVLVKASHFMGLERVVEGLIS